MIIITNREKGIPVLKTWPVQMKHIRKDDLAEWLNKDARKFKKAELEEMAREYVAKGDWHKKRFLGKFAAGTALSPTELEEALGCTRTERIRWTEEKKLCVAGYVDCKTPDGRSVTAAVYDRKFLEYKLDIGTVESWREEHRKHVERNRKKGAAAAVKTRRRLSSARGEILSEFQQERSKWETDGGRKTAAAFSVAYWAAWASRWAKAIQAKEYEAPWGRKQKLCKAKDAWYARKHAAMKMLVDMDMARISFYRPKGKVKESFHLCDRHYEDFAEERSFCGDLRAWDYFYCHRKEIMECPDCEYDADKNWFCLYYIEVADKHVPYARFSFHVPYALGSSYLPEERFLPKAKNHEEGEGMFRFGRPVWDNEKILYTEKMVSSMLEKAIREAEDFLSGKAVT